MVLSAVVLLLQLVGVIPSYGPCFVFDHLVACLSQHGLKLKGVGGGIQISPLIEVLPRIPAVSIRHGHILSLYIPNHLGQHIFSIGASAQSIAQRQILFTVENIHHRPAVIQKCLEKLLIKGISVGVLNVKVIVQ